MGKGWYKPQVVTQAPTLRAMKQLGKGSRGLRSMDLIGLSSTGDLAQLNSYLWDLRYAIVNMEIDGDHILPDTISSSEIAPKSVAASCLADPFVFDQDIAITGSLSAGGAICAASGIYTLGDVSAAGNISGDDIVAVGNLTATDITAETIVASVIISAYNVANLSVDGNARISGDLTADGVSANNGFETAASGEFHGGINTAFLSSTGDVIAGGSSLSSTWDTVNTNSASWGSGGAASATILVVEEGSAYWGSTHSTVSANSADWEAATTEVENGSAYWDSTHQSVSANSAYWMGISSLSGDLQVASLSTSGNVIAASGEFHEGINTTYLSCTGDSYFGGVNDHTGISSNGFMWMSGSPLPWDDIRVNALDMTKGAAADPTWAAFPAGETTRTWVFDAAVDNELFFSVQFPHSMANSADMDIHVHWSPTNTNTGACVWGIDITTAIIDGVFGTPITISAASAGAGTANTHQMQVLSTFPVSTLIGTLPDISWMAMCRVFRDANDDADTYDADAALLEVDFHIQRDCLGSDTILAKTWPD